MTPGSPYLDYFVFREDPFSLTPNPAYFYLTRQHELALEELTRGVNERKGIMLLIGEMGTGKTILLRTLEQSLGDDVLSSYQLNPALDFASIVRKMLSDMGVATSSDSKAQLISLCHEKLGELGKQGKCALLILDEAQSLSEEVLEDIRILSNIEDPRGKLLNLILAGQPELAEKISVSSLRSLKHRIGVRVYLKPMDADEISHYLEHRLKIAGWEGTAPLFAKDSLSWFTYSSSGNPRLINIIADNALHRAYRERQHVVDKEIIKETIAGLEGKETLRRKRKTKAFFLRRRNPVTIAVLLFLVVLVVYVASTVGERRARRAARQQDEVAPAEIAPAETTQPVAPPPETVFIREGEKAGEGVQLPAGDLPGDTGGAQEESPVTPPDTEEIQGQPDTPGQGAGREPAATEEQPQPSGLEQEIRPEPAGERGEAPPGDAAATPAAAAGSESPETLPMKEVMITGGDCLINILRREYGWWSWDLLNQVLELNKNIKDPNHIRAGERILLPVIGSEG